MWIVWTLISIGHYSMALWMAATVLRRPREPRAMLAWILTLLLLPVVGLLLFFFIGEPRLERHRRRRRRRFEKLAAALSRKLEALESAYGAGLSKSLSDKLFTLMRIGTRLSFHPPVRGNSVAIMHDGETAFLALQIAIKSARSHIHMEYYIFHPDETGAAIRDLLIERAKAGVECRLLLDYIGCWNMTDEFLRPLKEAGVAMEYFMPVIPLRGRFRVNFRNHRKLVVIDGHTGFTGSNNIGNEYLGRSSDFSQWLDTQIRIEGPAVQQLQEVFVEDWHDAAGEDLTSEKYFPVVAEAGEHVVQVIPSGPDRNVNALRQILFSAINFAERTVCAISPYFVPDGAIMAALQTAALRGVQVQVLIPSVTDQPVVLWAGRSFYEELIRAGVEIYEYDRGMVHSKVMVIDQMWGMVGSGNMDERSFRLNFELTTMLYDTKLAADLQQEFESLRAVARRITLEDLRNWSFMESLKVGAARLASPLL